MQVSQYGATIVVIEAKVKKSMETHVEQCAANHKCVICGAAEFSRGLCRSHYYQFHKAQKSLPKTRRPEFEAKQIREGKLLPMRTGGRPSKTEIVFQVD